MVVGRDHEIPRDDDCAYQGLQPVMDNLESVAFVPWPRTIGEEAREAPPRGTRFWQNRLGRSVLGHHHALPAERQRPRGADAMIRPAMRKQINALLGQEAVK